MAEPHRGRELALRLREVQEQVEAAARASSRDPSDVTLVVVTKTWPASDVRLLHALGVRDFGENRHPEAELKAAEVVDLELNWHFIGQIQSNKAAKIASYADLVHSVDSARVVQRLEAGARQTDRRVDCMVQVDLDGPVGPVGRGGVRPGEVEALAEAIIAANRLRLVGVMGVAPLGGDPVASYQRLREARDRLTRLVPTALAMSAGMSGDFPEAIAAGATHVRVGSAVLGQRPPLR